MNPRPSLRVPHECNSLEEYQQVHNLDLPGLTPAELTAELYRVGRIVARDPRAFVWVGGVHYPVRQWADARTQKISKALAPTPEAKTTRKPERSQAWAR